MICGKLGILNALGFIISACNGFTRTQPHHKLRHNRSGFVGHTGREPSLNLSEESEEVEESLHLKNTKLKNKLSFVMGRGRCRVRL